MLQLPTGARRRAIAEARATLGGERDLVALGHALRVGERRRETRRDIGEAAASGAARGFTGSYQALRAAEAEQAEARDLRLFEQEYAVENLRLAQRDAELDASLEVLDIEEIEKYDTGVAEARVGLARERATLSVAQAAEAQAGLTTDERRVALAQRNIAVTSAKLAQAERSVEETSVNLRSRVRIGQRTADVEQARIAGERPRIGARQLAADRQRDLLGVQYQAVGEQIARERTARDRDVAGREIERTRSLLQAGQARRAAGQKATDIKIVDQEARVQSYAELITNLQLKNLPSAEEYKRTSGAPSNAALIFSGIAQLLQH